MSKGKRRSTRARSTTQRNAPVSTIEAPQAIIQAPVPQPDEPEYRYVADDLRRVVILAAAMFALLIALSLFIR